MEFHPSRTKDNADPAGPSPPPELWKLLPRSADKLSVSPNNNWLTAVALKETKAATEDGHHLPLTMLRPAELPQKANIPTPLKTEPAKCKEEASRSEDTRVPQDAMASSTPLTPPLFPLLSMPPTGAATDPDPSATAPPESTTPSSWSVLWVETGRSRTPGEPAGESLDSSDWPTADLTLVVCAPMPVSCPHDL